jgi:hypothetical protein
MSVKPNFLELTLRSNKNLRSQSIVESRIAEKDSDIIKIIAVGSNAIVIGSETVAGEIRYSGRTIFNLVYENSEGKIIRSEYGIEFSHKAEREDILSSMKAEVYINTENTELKQLNGSFVLSTIATADIILSGSANYNYLSGGEGIIYKNEDCRVLKSLGCCRGGYELFEELECESLNDVLLHYESIVLTEVQSGIGCIICDGTVNLNIIYTTGTEQIKIGSLSKLIDFRFEINADEAMPNMKVSASAFVKGAKISVTVDDAKNKSLVAAEISVEVCSELFEEITISCVSDVYSTTNEINLTAECIKNEKPLLNKLYNEKVLDTAITGSEINFSSDIEGITQESLSIQATSISEGKITAEGVVTALALTKTNEGTIGSVTLELPFTLELELDGVTDKSKVLLSGIAHSVFARQKKEGEIEMEASMKIYARAFDYDYLTVISDVTEGDEILKKSSAISVFIPEKNDELWDVAKRLKENPEDILKYNSELEFPLKGEERIIIYRQHNIEY